MAKSIHLIGLEADELLTVNSVVSLLRHPDPILPPRFRSVSVWVQAADG